jgi:predicted signal transduction protein with EAL and GGDEF domain
LRKLKLYDILDSAAESEFDDIALLAAQICQTPISLISLVDTDRQWFKSRIGMEATQTDRDVAFCGHAITQDGLFVVNDARKDARFFDNPLVTRSPNIRFYAGTPLKISSEGSALGALCVIDTIPRELTIEQENSLEALGRQMVRLLSLRRAVADSREAEKFARSTVDSLTAHIAILDEAGTIIAVNRAWREFATRNPPATPDFAVGSNYLATCDAAAGPCSEEAIAVARGIRAVMARERDAFSLEYPCHSPSEKRWFVARISRFPGDGPTRVVVAHENVTQRRLAEERLRHASLHDALTGLPNRSLFADRIDRALGLYRRDPTRHFAVLFIDLDQFKLINDSMGHAAGDVLLKTVADRLRASLRTTDTLCRTGISEPDAGVRAEAEHTVARMGGDEFTLLLEGLKHPTDAALIAERALSSLSQPMQVNGKEVMVTASIGIVNGSLSYNNAQELLRDADSAMYGAKMGGKARYIVFDSRMHSAAVSRINLEMDLRRAIERGELLLHYQPVVSLESRELRKFEALLRWNRGKAAGEPKLVSPADFISIAEETGLIIPIGGWVLSEACRQLAAWKRAHPSAATMTMAVNVSGRQLTDERFISHLRNVLRDTQLDPASIRLEITESVMMDERLDIIEKLTAIKQTGVSLSMDDFGTGYSSLSCLHRLPLDAVKIDRSFVASMEGGRHAAAVVQAVINLAHNLNMQVVAEGLERPEQVAFLQSLDCDLGQGYFFSKPMAAEQAEAFMLKSHASGSVAA